MFLFSCLPLTFDLSARKVCLDEPWTPPPPTPFQWPFPPQLCIAGSGWSQAPMALCLAHQKAPDQVTGNRNHWEVIQPASEPICCYTCTNKMCQIHYLYCPFSSFRRAPPLSSLDHPSTLQHNSMDLNTSNLYTARPASHLTPRSGGRSRGEGR